MLFNGAAPASQRDISSDLSHCPFRIPFAAFTMSRRQRPEHNYYFDKAAETTVDSLAILAEYRRTGTRNSGDVVKRGEKVLGEKGALRKMGDEGVSKSQVLKDWSAADYSYPDAVWPFLEQLGFAALDTGKIDLASVRLLSWSEHCIAHC